ncbi:DUF6526 family protein [Luteitalea sp.]|jgi:hypothetical protein|uniref:DUF6526 family protein n=1 Tax=Luteitalea sp. TaxID=2004800 RepID=UPI0037CA2286
MSTQTYATHAHQPVPTFIGTALWMIAVAGVAAMLTGREWGAAFAWVGVLGCLFMQLAMGRVYTTKLQDRIIMLEEQLRAERLLPPATLAQWKALGVKHVVALRFAADEELAALTARAASESMTPDAIKRAITHWRADHRRT